MKKLAFALLTVSLMSLNITNSFAEMWTQGYDAPGKYKVDTSQCAYDEIYTPQFANKMNDGMKGGWVCTNLGTVYSNNYAWESDLTSGFADGVNFFAFAGHGFAYNGTFNPDGTPRHTITNGKGAGAHFYAVNSISTFHYSETGDTGALAQWDEIRWGKDKMRWALMYSCNFLKNGGDNGREQQIWNMFQGIHMMMGFASKMFVTDAEGTYLPAGLYQNATVKTAFVEGAKKYQPNMFKYTSNLGPVIVRVKYHSSYENDKRGSATTRAPAYSLSNASSFKTYDYTIYKQ